MMQVSQQDQFIRGHIGEQSTFVTMTSSPGK